MPETQAPSASALEVIVPSSYPEVFRDIIGTSFTYFHQKTKMMQKWEISLTHIHMLHPLPQGLPPNPQQASATKPIPTQSI
jgi:hypothetical protein